jgi:holo-ACP synthase CitX
MSEFVSSALLHAILQAKEQRAEVTAMITKKYCATVVVITLNIPGGRKNRSWTADCLDIGRNLFTQALKRMFPDVAYQNEWRNTTSAGPEYRSVVDLPAVVVKETAITVEESSPMGRLLDIDVYDSAGRSVTRGELKYASRPCLLCDRPAHECARSRRHAPTEIDARIEEIVAVLRSCRE